MTTSANYQPRAWVGCLACYNSGRLVGQWYDADEAEDDIAQIHKDGGYAGPCDGEEPWCFDTENLPGGEMDPATARKWGAMYEKLDNDAAWPAFLAYAANHHTDLYGMPEIEDFTDAYQGRWDEFSDYAHHYAEETALQQGWPDEAILHFNWDSYAESLEQGYWTADAPGGGIFVFTA